MPQSITTAPGLTQSPEMGKRYIYLLIAKIVITFNKMLLPNCHDENVRSPALFLDPLSLGMTDGDGGVVPEEELCGWGSDDLGSAQNDHMLPSHEVGIA